MRWNIDLVVYYKQVEIKFPWHLIVLLLTNNEPIMLGKIQIPPSCIYSDNKNLSVDDLQVFYWYKVIYEKWLFLSTESCSWQNDKTSKNNDSSTNGNL